METNIENIILKPLRRFALQKPNSSVLLFLATILAMILANSPLQDRYHHFLQFPISLTAGEFGFFTHHGQPLSMLAFVNDALMAVFFSPSVLKSNKRYWWANSVLSGKPCFLSSQLAEV